MTKPSLPSGRYIQIYRDKIPGNDRSAKLLSLESQLDRYKTLGITGILWHGFTKELTPSVFKPLAKLCSDRGLLALAAFGLDSENPEGKGKRIALVANMPECFATVFDMEGDWENEKTDKENALAMGNVFRANAPLALAIDQPWPVPTLHWSLFPWEESAMFVDLRAPQFYVNNYQKLYGGSRYEKCWAWYISAWKKLNERLSKSNLVKPMFPTIQGYGWILSDLIHCLTNNPTLFIWSEPYPDEVFMNGLEIEQKLKAIGFTGPDAVKNYQSSVGLKADNVCGPLTIKQLTSL